ncbi:MAG TPA: hypothetical protein VK698_21110 [Kofleriaceae bacterium]|nr:hypothetical protein [Kofleriaceae bacterium]
MLATGDGLRPGLLDRLRTRHGRRAGFAVLAVLALLVVHNGLRIILNQRDLRRADNSEIQDWFHVSPRDIESVARRHPRAGVNALMAVWYFLGKRIGDKHLTIPDWMAWSRWELEHVAHLEIEIADHPMMVDPRDGERLRLAGEERIYQRGSRKHRRMRPLYLIVDPAATRYVLAVQTGGAALFVLPEAQYAALSRSVPAATGARDAPKIPAAVAR